MTSQQPLRLARHCSQESDDQVVLHTFQLHSADHDSLEQKKACSEQAAGLTETVPTVSSIETKSNGGSECPIFLTNDEQPTTPPSPPVRGARELRKVSQQIFVMAYRERKMDSLRLLKTYHEEAISRGRVFVEVAKKLQFGLSNRLQSQKELLGSMVEYFGGMQQFLRDHYKAIQKSNCLQLPSKCKQQNADVATGLASLVGVYTDYHDCVRRLAKWIEQKLLPQLNQTLKTYIKSANCFEKDNDKSYSKIQEKIVQAQRRFVSAADSINDHKKTDLFCSELELFGLYRQLKERMSDLYKKIDGSWKTLLSSEEAMLAALKESVTNFLQEYSKVYPKSPQSAELQSFWRQLQLRTSDMFDWVWSCRFSEKAQTLGIASKQDLDQYALFSDFVTDLPQELRRFLFNRRFQAEVDWQANGKEWRRIELCLTVDNNVVLLHEGNVRSRMALSRLSCQIQQYRKVAVKQRPRRLFGQSTHQVIRFRLTEQAQQFVCYCQAHSSGSD